MAKRTGEGPLNHVPDLPELKEGIVVATPPILINDSLRLLAEMLVAPARESAPNGPLSPPEMPKKQLDVSADSELVSKAT